MNRADVDDGIDPPLVRRLTMRRYTSMQLLAIDVATVVVIAAASKSVMPHQQPRVSGLAWDVVNWLTYAAAPAATLFRRRLPRATLMVVVAIAVLAYGVRAGGPTVFFVLMALYSLVAVSPRRTALPVVAVVVAAVLSATVVGGGNQVVESCIGGIASLLLAWAAGENTRASRVYARQQEQRAANTAAAAEVERADHVSRALADERADIARELHDIVAHAMSVIAVRSGVARMVIDSQPDEAREALSIIENTTRRSLQEMRLLVAVLRRSDDDGATLVPAPGLRDLEQLIAEASSAGVAVELNVSGTMRAIPPSVDLSAYRIVQEALTNVVQHVGPTSVCVEICYRPDEVGIEIIDQGAVTTSARPLPPGHGHGLIGMRERAALFGGEFDAGPCAKGYRVKASLRTDESHRSFATTRTLDS